MARRAADAVLLKIGRRGEQGGGKRSCDTCARKKRSCDGERPCQRCVAQLGYSAAVETCVDAPPNYKALWFSAAVAAPPGGGRPAKPGSRGGWAGDGDGGMFSGAKRSRASRAADGGGSGDDDIEFDAGAALEGSDVAAWEELPPDEAAGTDAFVMRRGPAVRTPFMQMLQGLHEPTRAMAGIAGIGAAVAAAGGARGLSTSRAAIDPHVFAALWASCMPPSAAHGSFREAVPRTEHVPPVPNDALAAGIMPLPDDMLLGLLGLRSAGGDAMTMGHRADAATASAPVGRDAWTYELYERDLFDMFHACVEAALEALPIPVIRVAFHRSHLVPRIGFCNSAAMDLLGIEVDRIVANMQEGRAVPWLHPDFALARILMHLDMRNAGYRQHTFNGVYLRGLQPHIPALYATGSPAASAAPAASLQPSYRLFQATEVVRTEYWPDGATHSNTVFFTNVRHHYRSLGDSIDLRTIRKVSDLLLLQPQSFPSVATAMRLSGEKLTPRAILWQPPTAGSATPSRASGTMTSPSRTHSPYSPGPATSQAISLPQDPAAASTSGSDSAAAGGRGHDGDTAMAGAGPVGEGSSATAACTAPLLVPMGSRPDPPAVVIKTTLLPTMPHKIHHPTVAATLLSVMRQIAAASGHGEGAGAATDVDDAATAATTARMGLPPATGRHTVELRTSKARILLVPPFAEMSAMAAAAAAAAAESGLRSGSLGASGLPSVVPLQVTSLATAVDQLSLGGRPRMPTPAGSVETSEATTAADGGSPAHYHSGSHMAPPSPSRIVEVTPRFTTVTHTHTPAPPAHSLPCHPLTAYRPRQPHAGLPQPFRPAPRPPPPPPPWPSMRPPYT